MEARVVSRALYLSAVVMLGLGTFLGWRIAQEDAGRGRFVQGMFLAVAVVDAILGRLISSGKIPLKRK